MKNKVYKTMVMILVMINLMVLPICAAGNVVTTSIEPRFNNVFSATLTLGFDSNNIAYCSIGVTPYSHCTGMDGMMRLLDADGNLLKSWAVYDHEEPYSVENTWQVEDGGTYTVTFQGYAYGSGTMYDEINLSVTDTCE